MYPQNTHPSIPTNPNPNEPNGSANQPYIPPMYYQPQPPYPALPPPAPNPHSMYASYANIPWAVQHAAPQALQTHPYHPNMHHLQHPVQVIPPQPYPYHQYMPPPPHYYPQQHYPNNPPLLIQHTNPSQYPNNPPSHLHGLPTHTGTTNILPQPYPPQSHPTAFSSAQINSGVDNHQRPPAAQIDIAQEKTSAHTGKSTLVPPCDQCPSTQTYKANPPATSTAPQIQPLDSAPKSNFNYSRHHPPGANPSPPVIPIKIHNNVLDNGLDLPPLPPPLPSKYLRSSPPHLSNPPSHDLSAASSLETCYYQHSEPESPPGKLQIHIQQVNELNPFSDVEDKPKQPKVNSPLVIDECPLISDFSTYNFKVGGNCNDPLTLEICTHINS